MVIKHISHTPTSGLLASEPEWTPGAAPRYMPTPLPSTDRFCVCSDNPNASAIRWEACERDGFGYGGQWNFGSSDLYLVGKVSLRRVKFEDGDYEKGTGRYFGCNSHGSILYRAEDSDGRAVYVRARDRADAKAKISSYVGPCPLARPRFYR